MSPSPRGNKKVAGLRIPRPLVAPRSPRPPSHQSHVSVAKESEADEKKEELEVEEDDIVVQPENQQLMRKMSVLKRDRSKDIPTTYEIFDKTNEACLKFNVLGLWNTRREQVSFYRLEAILHDTKFSINECNWKTTTQGVWCF